MPLPTTPLMHIAKDFSDQRAFDQEIADIALLANKPFHEIANEVCTIAENTLCSYNDALGIIRGRYLHYTSGKALRSHTLLNCFIGYSHINRWRIARRKIVRYLRDTL